MNRPDRPLELEPFGERRWRSYLTLAVRAFGPHSYQADERYIRWLYDECPMPADGAVVADGEQVVGCLHKFRLPWRIDGAQHRVATAHNLYVAPEYRGGVGTMLILHTMRGESAIFIPGAAGAAGTMYEKLRWQQIGTEWHRLVSPSWPGAWRAMSGGAAAYDAMSHGGMVMTSTPHAEAIDACIEALNAVAGMRPLWSRETFVWRFFHRFGPRHVLASLDGAAFALFSCGVRNRVRLARLIDAAYDDADRFATLMRWATKELARRGVLLAWSYSASDDLNRQMARLGWRTIAHAPRSFLYLRKGSSAAPAALNASAGDFGFESIRDHR